MGQGLGHRQTLALRALRVLEIDRGAGAWHSPAAVLAVLHRLDPPRRHPALEHMERAERLQLEDAQAMVSRGVLSFRATVYALEARIGERRRREFYERQREADERKPNTVRRKARAGEDLNPSRVFASLEARGLVERRAHCGPGSAVRLVKRERTV